MPHAPAQSQPATQTPSQGNGVCLFLAPPLLAHAPSQHPGQHLSPYPGHQPGQAQLPAQLPATDLHQLAESLGNAIDAKDASTARHSEEVAEAARRLALAMGLSACQAEDMHVAGHLHDIGKIGIPGAILRKRGPLNAEEWAMIRRHPAIGADILRPVDALRRAGVPDMALHHHERFDGSGYPDGLTGADIPLGARIIAVADSLSAMLQHRTYRPALSFEEASAEIQAGAGTQFDPAVVEAFWKDRAGIRALMARLGSMERG